jgi:hypothetical protein
MLMARRRQPIAASENPTAASEKPMAGTRCSAPDTRHRHDLV